MFNDFEKFAISRGISSNTLDGYNKHCLKNSIIEPYILEERDLNVATMSVFSRLFYDRIIFLASDVNPDSSNIIKAQLLFLNSTGTEDISFFIDSPGGDVTSGLAIYDVMNFIKPKVATYCMGLCASMGAVLLSSGAKGKRYSMPHGDIMIHQPMGGVRPGTQESDFAIEYEQIKKCKDTLYEILSENTGKSVEEITVAADRDKWFTAKEAVEFGLIDSIVKKSK